MNLKYTPKPWTDWVRAIAAFIAAVAAVLVPIMAAYISSQYNESIKEREIRARYVELAISILREDPAKQNIGLREWAVAVVDQYTTVPFSDVARKALLSKPLPILEREVLDAFDFTSSPKYINVYRELLEKVLEEKQKGGTK